MLDNVLGNSGKLGGPNKTAQVGESKFGRRKYNTYLLHGAESFLRS